MLTFKQLRELIRVPDSNEKTPKIRELQKCGAKIVVREMLGQSSSITVYENGYVLYQDGERWACFPFPQEQEYRYKTVLSAVHIPAQFWENESWYIGLLLFGEDKLSESNRKREKRDGNVISYSGVGEDWKLLADWRLNEMEQRIQRELVDEVLALATEKQRQVLFLYYLQDMSHKAIAEEMGVSRRAVTDMIRKGIERIRRAYGIETKGVKRDRYNHT